MGFKIFIKSKFNGYHFENNEKMFLKYFHFIRWTRLMFCNNRNRFVGFVAIVNITTKYKLFYETNKMVSNCYIKKKLKQFYSIFLV